MSSLAGRREAVRMVTDLVLARWGSARVPREVFEDPNNPPPSGATLQMLSAEVERLESLVMAHSKWSAAPALPERRARVLVNTRVITAEQDLPLAHPAFLCEDDSESAVPGGIWLAQSKLLSYPMWALSYDATGVLDSVSSMDTLVLPAGATALAIKVPRNTATLTIMIQHRLGDRVSIKDATLSTASDEYAAVEGCSPLAFNYYVEYVTQLVKVKTFFGSARKRITVAIEHFDRTGGLVGSLPVQVGSAAMVHIGPNTTIVRLTVPTIEGTYTHKLITLGIEGRSADSRVALLDWHPMTQWADDYAVERGRSLIARSVAYNISKEVIW